MTKHSVDRLTDEELIAHLTAAAKVERDATAKLIALLAEMDMRRLYLARGYSSLFVYCTRSLRLSEHAAYGRIEAARAARKWPLILDLLADGSVTLTTICLLASHLTAANHRALLESARHKSKRDVEHVIAALRPLASVPSLIRKLPERQPMRAQVEPVGALEKDPPSSSRVGNAMPDYTPSPKPSPLTIRPLAPERYKVQVTIDQSTHDKLRRAQDLLRHVVPNGDPAIILDRALTALLQHLERSKIARVDRPHPARAPKMRTRHVPASIRREVWKRDDGRCAFVGTDGRCGEQGFLEFHHVVPFAEGGETSAANLQLRCRAHNAYEATEHFGVSLLREASTEYELGRCGLGPDRRREEKPMVLW